MKQALTPDETQRVILGESGSPFKAGRAMADVTWLAKLGPRPTKSTAQSSVRAYLAKELSGAGWNLWESPPASDTPGPYVILAEVRGAEKSSVLLVTACDTPPTAGPGFAGAHTGGSGTAVLLELARSLERRRPGDTLLLAWVNGAWPAEGKTAAAPGAPVLLDLLKAQNLLDRVKAAVVLEDLGDCYLSLGRDAKAPAWMADPLQASARRLGYERHFSQAEGGEIPLAAALRQAGLPALELSDLYFGGFAPQHQNLYLTGADTPDRVCAASLKAVGDVLYDALPAITAPITDQRKQPS